MAPSARALFSLARVFARYQAVIAAKKNIFVEQCMLLLHVITQYILQLTPSLGGCRLLPMYYFCAV